MLETLLNKSQTSQNEERMAWGSINEYYLSLIGFAVGFGSLWRFPYLVYENGGGAFLIPYTIFFFILAIPLFYLESALGQMYQQSAPVCLEKAGKRFRGVGIAQIFTSFSLGGFYNILMAYALIFLWKSFTWHLPWEIEQDPNSPTGQIWDYDYFYKEILQRTDSISDLGGFNSSVVIASIVSFIIVYLCTVNGLKTTGKVVYVSAPLPYILLFILLIRGLFLEGAWDGIKFLFEIDWSKIWEFEVWYRAANQVLFQYAVAIGGLHALASFKEKTTSIIRPSIHIPIIIGLTGILCGFTVFAYMGHMANVAGISMRELPLQGPELVFVAYPAALTLMPGAPIWAILFFLMLYTLGVDSEFTFLETVGAYLEDEKIKFFGRTPKIQVARFVLVVAFFLLGIFLYTRAGFYFVTLYDDYITIIPYALIATLECLIYGWISGTDEIKALIWEHVQEKYPPAFILCIKYLALPVLVIILIGSFWQVMIVKLFTYPIWGIGIGFCFTGIPVSMIIYYYVKYKNWKCEEPEEKRTTIELINYA